MFRQFPVALPALLTQLPLPVLLLALVFSALMPGQAAGQSADSSLTRCENSLGKDAVGVTVQTCRLELTGTNLDTRRIRILETLGKAYLAQNEVDAAIATWNEASQYTQPSRDDLKASESWARLQVLIGQTFAQAAQMEKAENQLRKTLEKVENTNGRYSLPAGLVQDSLGAFHSLQNKPAEAETAFKRARIVYELRLGKTNLKTLESRMNQAVGLLDMGKEQEALNQFQVLADIMNPLEQFRNEPVRAEVLTFLGTLQMRNEQLQQASSNYQAAFEIRQNVYGPRDIRTSQSLNNLGVVLYRAGKLQAAEAALGKAYIIRADALGAADPLTISTQKNLQAVIAAQNRMKETQAR